MGFRSSGYGWSTRGASSTTDLESRLRFGVELSGDQNGVNQTYTAPEFFTLGTMQVYWNGNRNHKGATHDFTVSESGGVGTGYDTITFTGVAPLPEDHILADYVAAP